MKFKIRLTEEKEEMTSHFQTPPTLKSHKVLISLFYKKKPQKSWLQNY